ncbi:MAG: aminotransferase class I/II-fold pyridoxal phosphate-dependent enzyme [Acidimicrobiales bacterium]
MTVWRGWLDERLDEVRRSDRWRCTEVFDPRAGALVSFASNDYLGLTSWRSVVAAAREALEQWGAGSTSSRLLSGTRPVHAALESSLAAWKGTEAALVLATGYAANLAVLSVLRGSGATIFSDERNHASIIDGCRLAQAPVVVYPHLALDTLAASMAETRGPLVVVSESVFSMDGDVAPVRELAQLCAQREALLILDEAHAVLGPKLGPDGPDGLDLLRVGTLSKALGSLGGFVAGSRRWIDWLVNAARPFIFTTAPTPADCAAAAAAIDVVRSPQGAALVARLRRHVERVKPRHPSPIIPVLLGSERHALEVAAALRRQGLLVPAIRPPTVAPGTARLRLSLSAAHSDEDIERLVGALASLDLPVPTGP